MLSDHENNIRYKSLKKDLNKLAEYKDFTIIYLCHQCSSSILINNLHYDTNKKKIYLECECKCRRIKNFRIDDYYNEFEYKEYEQSKDIIIINNLKCFKHEGAKFEYYCTDCEKDLCKNCIGEIHPNHTLIPYNSKIKDELIEKINKSMDIRDNNENCKNNQRDINNDDIFNANNNIIINKSNFTIKDIDIQSKKSLSKLLDKLKSVYSSYPCYNLDKSIINISKFCSNINKFVIENKTYKLLEKKCERKIRFIWEFNQVPHDEDIISAHLEEQGLLKIVGLQKYNLEHLEILKLKNNNLTDISPLKSIDFPNLKTLSLEENKIKDINYKVFEALNAPNLVFINLFKNLFKSPLIFRTLQNFKKLKKFFIGNNKIEDTYDNNDYDCSHITEIGLSLGVFDTKTISKIVNFNFEKTKIIYLNSNNIHSLLFIKKLRCSNLEEIWLMNNFIETFSELERFENLKIVNLKNNKINNISKLEEFVNKLPKLEKMVLSENKIEMNRNNMKILAKINEKYKIEL